MVYRPLLFRWEASPAGRDLGVRAMEEAHVDRVSLVASGATVSRAGRLCSIEALNSHANFQAHSLRNVERYKGMGYMERGETI